jgi:hypothetical protein
MAENRDWATRDSLRTSETDNRDITEAIEDTDIFDDNSSNPDWISEASSSADSDPEGYPFDERLRQPTKYFQELDSLESKVFENSMIQFYTVIL